MDLRKHPKIKKLLDDYEELTARVKTVYPETTFTSYTSIMTGLLPKNHKVPGDRFKTFLPTRDEDFFADPNSVNAYLTRMNTKTIFDYLDEGKYSSAAVASPFNKGIGSSPPNKVVPVTMDLATGNINNFNQLITYLHSLNERDNQRYNDAPDLFSV